MANIQALFSIRGEDGSAVPYSDRFFITLPDTVTLAQLQTISTALNAKFLAITDGSILEIKFEAMMVVTASQTPAVGSNVERCGAFRGDVEGSPYAYTVIVPAFAASKITSTGQINVGDTDVQAFVDYLKAAPVTGGEWDNDAYQKIVQFKDAYIPFRKHRRKQDAVSLTGAPS